jgi:hypothetical protein
MGDFLSEFSKAQVDFVNKHVKAFINNVPLEMKININEALFAAFIADVTRSRILTMQEYAQWLACKLIRSKNLKKQTMPNCDDGNLFAVISNKHNLPMWLVAAYVSEFTRPGTRLPLLGKVTKDGMFIPDKAALKKYEACFVGWGGDQANP